MTVDATSARLSVIEETWQAASKAELLGYLNELTEMARNLEQITGPPAEHAQWATRRVHRVVRHINNDPDPH